MKMNFKERMHDERPYWKVAVSLAVSLVATVVCIYVGIRMLGFFMPFVIGWFIAYVVSPLVNWLEKRIKIRRKLGSGLIIVAVLAVVCLLIYLAGQLLVNEVTKLIQNVPSMYHDLENGMEKIGNSFEGILKMVPPSVQESWTEMTTDFDRTMAQIMGKISDPTVTAVGNFAMKIPTVLVSTIVTIVSAYFFVSDREEVIAWSKKVAPEPLVGRMSLVMENLKYAVGGYFKAQFKIMVVVFGILLVGFFILQVHFSFLLAILISFLDFLPFFGTGTALIPWMVYKVLVGNYKMAIGLVVLYAVTQLVRQVIQPKLVGDSIGMKPLVTLVLLFVGYKIGGIIAMIFAVPIGMIVINLYKAGAFDYILDDVRILVEGLMSLRE